MSVRITTGGNLALNESHPLESMIFPLSVLTSAAGIFITMSKGNDGVFLEVGDQGKNMCWTADLSICFSSQQLSTSMI